MLKNEERIVKAATYFNNVSPSEFQRDFYKQWLWFRQLINLILDTDEPKQRGKLKQQEIEDFFLQDEGDDTGRSGQVD